MAPQGAAKVAAAKRDGSWTMLDAVEALEVPSDLANEETARLANDGVRANQWRKAGSGRSTTALENQVPQWSR